MDEDDMADFDEAVAESPKVTKHGTGTLKGPILIPTMHAAALKTKAPAPHTKVDDDDLADLDDLGETEDPPSMSINRSTSGMAPPPSAHFNALGNLPVRNQGAGPSPRAHSPTSFSAPSTSVASSNQNSLSSQPALSDPSRSPVEAALERFVAFCRISKPGAPSPAVASSAEGLLNDLRRAVLFYGLPVEASPATTIATFGPEGGAPRSTDAEDGKGVQATPEAALAVPEAATLSTQAVCSLRGRVWKALMLGPILCQRYAEGISGNGAKSADRSSRTPQSPPRQDVPEVAGADASTPQKSSLKPARPGSPGSASPALSSISIASRGQAAPGTRASGSAAANVAASLLATPYVLAEDYATLCREKCARYTLIRDDSFRTFRTKDPANKFLRAVPEQAIVRVCNAFDRKYAATGGVYCQGLNVFAGVLLYVLPELDAFNLFSVLVTQFVPLYFRSNHIGAQAGCVLVDRVLSIVDPELFAHLNSCSPPIRAIHSSFHAVSTLCASVPPIDEVLLLWDFLFAMGPHMAVLIVVAQLISMRSKVCNC